MRFGLKQRICLLAGGAVCLLSWGCGNPKSSESTKVEESAPAIDQANTGSISGKVAFSGEAPKMKTIDMSGTAACAQQHPAPQEAEDIVVNGNHTLKNVFVWVKEGVPDRAWPTPHNAVVLDQNGCMYRPRVIGVMVNQDIKFTNSDSTNHNVHPLPRLNAEWNESEAPKTSDVVKRFSKQEVMMPVKCNIHPWMRAYIGVVNHPFFAVTGSDGSFKITGLPPGKYTIETWHERYGKKELEVTVAAKEDKTLDFAYSGQ